MTDVTCVPCNQKYRALKNGAPLVKMFQDPPQPYEVYDADLWQWPTCGHKIVCGIAYQPYLQHWQPEFEEKFAQLKDLIIQYEKPL